VSGQAGDNRMTDAWQQWEGQVVNGEFHLRQYLGGGENRAVFLTEHGERELQKAAIKLVPALPEKSELQLCQWRLAAKLSHPHLIRLFRIGRCELGEMEMLYVVMEYAEENLSQILPQRPVTPAEAREMLEPVLEAGLAPVEAGEERQAQGGHDARDHQRDPAQEARLLARREADQERPDQGQEGDQGQHGQERIQVRARPAAPAPIHRA